MILHNLKLSLNLLDYSFSNWLLYNVNLFYYNMNKMIGKIIVPLFSWGTLGTSVEPLLLPRAHIIEIQLSYKLNKSENNIKLQCSNELNLDKSYTIFMNYLNEINKTHELRGCRVRPSKMFDVRNCGMKQALGQCPQHVARVTFVIHRHSKNYTEILLKTNIFFLYNFKYLAHFV
jgi:hypothetical protein